MGEGLGWGLNKTTQRQNPVFTSLDGEPSVREADDTAPAG